MTNRSRAFLEALYRPLPAVFTSTEDPPLKTWLFLAAGVAGLTWKWSETNSITHSEVAPLTETQERPKWSIKNLLEFSFFSLERRKKIFFKYEKRIRSLSTPEKIFDYFSSLEEDDVRYMTSADLLRALVPVYPPEGSPIERGGALLGEKAPCEETVKFFQLFDLDGDNLISFHEYLMVLVLLSIPLRDIAVIFDVVDLDDNGVIDRDEFQRLMDKIKHQSRQAQKSCGGKRTGLKTGESEETGLLVKFFGKDGHQKLPLAKFKQFLDELNTNMVVLEFMHYDYHDKQSITAKDFARSMVAGMSVRSIGHYLNVIDSMDEKLAGYEFNLDDFKGFHDLVHPLRELGVALHFYELIHGPLPMKELGLIVEHLTGHQMNQKVLEIVYYVFCDGKGNFDSNGFLTALSTRIKGAVSSRAVDVQFKFD